MTMLAVVLLLQSAAGLTAPPMIVKPPTDAEVRPALRDLGSSLEIAGHCSRFIPKADMDKFFMIASANEPDMPYLMSRLSKGIREPKAEAWCAKNTKSR